MKVNVKYSYFKENLCSFKSLFTKGEYNKDNKTIELDFEETEEFSALIKYTNNLEFICKILGLNYVPHYVNAIDTLSSFHIFNEEQRKQAEKILIDHFNEAPQILTISMLASRIDYDTEDEKEKTKEIAKAINREQKKDRKDRINKIMENRRIQQEKEFLRKHPRKYLVD